jgi:hypothetical protein
MLITFIILFILALAGLIYFAYRAFVLAGLLADTQEFYETVEMSNMYMYEKIMLAHEEMQRIDRLGAFEKDDEAGTTFQLLKQVIDDLKEEFNGESQEEK